jgi:hypothetical protein
MKGVAVGDISSVFNAVGSPVGGKVGLEVIAFPQAVDKNIKIKTATEVLISEWPYHSAVRVQRQMPAYQHGIPPRIFYPTSFKIDYTPNLEMSQLSRMQAKINSQRRVPWILSRAVTDQEIIVMRG